MIISRHIDNENIKKAEQVLIDNGIDPEEADSVLQALGYSLLDTELYPAWEPVEPKYRIRFTDKFDDACENFTDEPNDEYVVADIYAYDDEHLESLMEQIIEAPFGMWYWVTDLTTGQTFISGACDEGDLEILNEYV